MIEYKNKTIPLKFALRLKDFRIGHYPGTLRAATYESDVVLPGGEVVNISMNEPLKYKGFTFYQSSYEQDELGRPVASILTVNYDPGRGLKYLGSLLIVLGALILFYFKRMQFSMKRSQA